MQDIKKKFWLENFDCFSITGKDARKFLNGITTSNILNSENKVIKTCWLTPNGVLRALIEIIILERNLEVIILVGNTNEIIVPNDSYFFLGDNRDNSNDSRFWGSVNFDRLVGKAQIIFFSTEGGSKFYEIWKWPFDIQFKRLLKLIS